MDKGRKLKRYGRKDYTQLVQFPVEIIGRDGVVRRYDFEQSIRLYQRRIASAGLRYADSDLVHAELRHCRQRIEQLRRSYFVRHGWPELEKLGVFVHSNANPAADLAAFLRRCLISAEKDQPALDLVRVEGESRRSSFYVSRRLEGQADDSTQGFLVTVYCLDSGEDCPVRSLFFDELKLLQGAQGTGPQVERLIAFHHTSDCGFLLTQVSGPVFGGAGAGCGGGEAHPFQSVPAPSDVALSTDQRALQLLRQGRHRSALRRFIESYESNPLSRRSYLGAIVAADLVNAVSLAEAAALMGSPLGQPH